MIYIHVPLCKSFCTYCGFYSELCAGPGSGAMQERYVRALLSEIDSRRDELARAVVPDAGCSPAGMPDVDGTAGPNPDTLYVGGGTPSVLETRHLRTIISALGRMPNGECTIEVNPDDIAERGAGYVMELLGMGFNRISMGIQSLDDGILRWMRRRHDSREALEAFDILRRGGADNISVDLIFGISQLSDKQWTDSLDKVIALRPEHISAYQLSIDDGSVLRQMTDSGRYTEAADEDCARQYRLMCDRLREAGYRHYEISNWARPGFEARHNSAYWKRMPYIGLGPGAHSFDGMIRSWNTQTLDAYSRKSETLTHEDIRVETIMLGLRTSGGIDQAWLEANCERHTLTRLLDKGLLVEVKGISGEGEGPMVEVGRTEAGGEAKADGETEAGRLENAGGQAAPPRLRIPEERWFVSEDIIRDLI